VTSTIPHYTIEANHIRHASRSEVSDDLLASLKPLLSNGRHVLPVIDGYSVDSSVCGSILAATICSERNPFGEALPLVTAYVCEDESGLASVLRVTGARNHPELRAPCVVATMHPTAMTDKKAMGWMGDFERCLAWAWLERNKH